MGGGSGANHVGWLFGDLTGPVLSELHATLSVKPNESADDKRLGRDTSGFLWRWFLAGIVVVVVSVLLYFLAWELVGESTRSEHGGTISAGTILFERIDRAKQFRTSALGARLEST